LATVGELEAKALVDTLADKVSEIKAGTSAYTLGHANFEALLDTLAYTLQPVAKMLRHSHEKTTCLASNRC